MCLISTEHFKIVPEPRQLKLVVVVDAAWLGWPRVGLGSKEGHDNKRFLFNFIFEDVKGSIRTESS